MERKISNDRTCYLRETRIIILTFQLSVETIIVGARNESSVYGTANSTTDMRMYFYAQACFRTKDDWTRSCRTQDIQR